jgi:putative oxidoreductase
MTDYDKKLQWSLLLTRLSVFLVMFIWTIDKFVNPAHAAKIFEIFYYMSGFGPAAMCAAGVVEIIILLLLLAGYGGNYAYGAVLVFHAVSTLSSFRQYLGSL